MGGKGSGGHRTGSGRKPKSNRERTVEGARVLAHPSAASTAPPLVEEFDAPDDLTMDERHVWMELAPHAFQGRTLNRATSLAFRLLCRNVVLERELSKDVELRGGANHRGIIQRVDAELARFMCAPMGKPHEIVPASAAPANPLDRFLKRG